MKKKVCEDCGQPMTKHTVEKVGRGLVWVCPRMYLPGGGPVPVREV